MAVSGVKVFNFNFREICEIVKISSTGTIKKLLNKFDMFGDLNDKYHLSGANSRSSIDSSLPE